MGKDKPARRMELGMKSGAVAASIVLIAVAIAGCTNDPDRAAPNRDVRQAWERERSQHGPVGIAATFDLQGRPLLLQGEGQASVAAPFDLRPEPPTFTEHRYVYFQDARVGTKGPGLLIVEGLPVRVTAGSWSFRSASADIDAGVDLSTVRGSTPVRADVAFPPAWEDAKTAAVHTAAVEGAVAGWTVDGHSRAVLIDASGATDLTGPITVSASGLAWDADSRVRVASADLTLADFALGGNVTAGELRAEGSAPRVAPKGVFGRDASLHVEPGRVRTTGTFRLTQTLTEQGLVTAAKVEVLNSQPHVTVAAGNSTWVSVSYREAGYVGDAALKDVKVTGTGASMVKFPVKEPPLWIHEFWNEMMDKGAGHPWAQAFIVFGLVLASPALVFIQVLLTVLCLATVCPEQSPYPSWMPAGDVGVFYFQVTGGSTPGTYPVHILVTGQNYPDVKIDLDVTVTPRAA